MPAGLFDFVGWGWDQGCSYGHTHGGGTGPVGLRPGVRPCHHPRVLRYTDPHLPRPREPAPGQGSFHPGVLVPPASYSSPRPDTRRSGLCPLAVTAQAESKATGVGKGVATGSAAEAMAGPFQQASHPSPRPNLDPTLVRCLGREASSAAPAPLPTGDGGHGATAATRSLGPNEKESDVQKYIFNPV